MTGKLGAFASSPEERRRFGRQTTFKPASVILADGREFACTVVDMSSGGAAFRLAVGTDERVLPEAFLLLIIPDKVIAACRRSHFTNGKVGVEFVAPPRIASLAPSRRALKERAIAWLVQRA